VPTEAEFVARVLAGQPEPPTYFATMKELNKRGPRVLGPRPAPPRGDDAHLLALLSGNAVVVDTRPAADYAAGHLRGTLNIPLDQAFVTWAGWLLPYTEDLYVIADDPADANVTEIVRQLGLIGLDRVVAVFDSAAVARVASRGTDLDTVRQVTSSEVSGLAAAGDITLLDVRNASEWGRGHVPSAMHIPLGALAQRLGEVPADRPLVVHCQGGRRSAIAASLLQRAGRSDVSNLVGGFEAWTGSGLPVTVPTAK
jgi:hydroxyacylglutathione hydrolase